MQSESFKLIKDVLKARSVSARNQRYENPEYCLPFPNEIGVKWTYSCNFKCKHCYLWGEEGQYKKVDPLIINDHLKFESVIKLFEDKNLANTKFRLSGGEPLLYAYWDEIFTYLKKLNRDILIFTNGSLLHGRLESLLQISESLTIMLSLDGFLDIHESIRGKGTYDRIIDNLQLMLSLQHKGIYKGKIIINTTLNKHLIPVLDEFVGYCERLGIKNLLIGFPWYISKDVCLKMDNYYNANFHWLSKEKAQKGSWHSFSYHLSLEDIKLLQKQLKVIFSKKRDMQINLNPSLNLSEIENFISGNVQKKNTFCTAISHQCEIRADGSVSACKVFPEFVVGNIYQNSLEEIWHGDLFKKVRIQMNQDMLSGKWPAEVCLKCSYHSNNIS